MPERDLDLKFIREAITWTNDCLPKKPVKPWTSPLHRFLIALRSPTARLETGLHSRLPEKTPDYGSFAEEWSVLRSPVWLSIIAKYGHCSRISAQGERKFCAVQTAWRRKRDSNSRYGFVGLRLDVSASCR
jgi:hypothetical protein